ncbi:HgcAB-associated protein HgcC [candidate division KSB1 bacterium]
MKESNSGKKSAGCATGSSSACCRVEAVVSVDERGQMVLPKEVRSKAGIKPGDKFAVVLMESENEVCCISLIKIERLAGMVKDILGPVMKEIL